MASKLATRTDKLLTDKQKDGTCSEHTKLLRDNAIDLVDPRVIPTGHDTGFKEPLSKERNTTLPHPEGLKANSAITEEDLRAKEFVKKHVGMKGKIKGEIEIIEGKILHKPRLVEEGRALKHGVRIQET
jgi:hypothetical protein